MSELDMKFEELAEQLLNDEITPEEHVEQYKQLINDHADADSYGWQPHEHI